MLLLGALFLLAVSLHRAERGRFACFSLDGSAQVRVVYCRVRLVGAQDGCADVLLHLASAEYARSARATFVLQRHRGSIPPRMPLSDKFVSALHCEAASECLEASTTLVCRVVCEDVMLLLWSEAAHRGWCAAEGEMRQKN
jgi:hypothetical protein